jgi:hypothetical protein
MLTPYFRAFEASLSPRTARFEESGTGTRAELASLASRLRSSTGRQPVADAMNRAHRNVQLRRSGT